MRRWKDVEGGMRGRKDAKEGRRGTKYIEGRSRGRKDVREEGEEIGCRRRKKRKEEC
jgi:hypothetical protein